MSKDTDSYDSDTESTQELLEKLPTLPEKTSLAVSQNIHYIDTDLNKEPNKVIEYDLTKAPDPLGDTLNFLEDIDVSELNYKPLPQVILTEIDRRHGAYISNYPVKALKTVKRLHLLYNQQHLRNGFYTGFTATVMCDNCERPLDCFPCRQKRCYLVTKANCIYCTGKAPTLEDSVKALQNTKYNNKKMKFFYLRTDDFSVN